MKHPIAHTQIQSIEALETCVGTTPGPRDLKVIDHLDEHALRWLSVSPCLFASVATRADHGVRALIAGGEPGFVKASTNQLIVSPESLDNADALGMGDGWGSLFVIPSLKESLRVNGTVTAVSKSAITIRVTECYLHCAKAFMRSKLWEEYESPSAIKTEDEFCKLTRFMLVATSDDQLRADMSPKGDPAGKLLDLRDNFAWYPDRPGNRRVDGFRNLLSQPNTEMLALVAGSSQILRIRGKALLFSEHPQREHFRVKDKLPHLIVRINPEKITLENSGALARANMWPPQAPEMTFKASEIWQAHMQGSNIEGFQAKVAKTAISLPGVLEKGLDWDYKNNMY